MSLGPPLVIALSAVSFGLNAHGERQLVNDLCTSAHERTFHN